MNKKADNLSPLDERLIAGLFFKRITNDQFIHHKKKDSHEDLIFHSKKMSDFRHRRIKRYQNHSVKLNTLAIEV